MELITQLSRCISELDDITESIKKYGEERARAERDYKVALMKKSLELKAEGMAVTLIDKTVYGCVADERLARDTADVMYETEKERLNVLKLKARLLDAQLSREWGQSR